MPVSSTFSTSAPRSASSSEQKPPGSRRVRSRTLTSLSGRPLTPGDPQELARLGDAGGAAADVFGHLPRLGDQLAVGLAHLAVRQVEVVLDPGTDVAAEHQRGREQLPLVAGDADHLPLVRPLGAAGDLVAHQGDVGRMPPVTPITSEICSGGSSRPMSTSGSRLATWPESKHSCSGLTPISFIAVRNSMIVSKLFSKTALKTKSLRRFEYFALFIE